MNQDCWSNFRWFSDCIPRQWEEYVQIIQSARIRWSISSECGSTIRCSCALSSSYAICNHRGSFIRFRQPIIRSRRSLYRSKFYTLCCNVVPDQPFGFLTETLSVEVKHKGRNEDLTQNNDCTMKTPCGDPALDIKPDTTFSETISQTRTIHYQPNP